MKDSIGLLDSNFVERLSQSRPGQRCHAILVEIVGGLLEVARQRYRCVEPQIFGL
jgi:hypothetical protein